jgi:hypothetical protein
MQLLNAYLNEHNYARWRWNVNRPVASRIEPEGLDALATWFLQNHCHGCGVLTNWSYPPAEHSHPPSAIMDVTTFAAFQRASEQLSANNQAVIDWGDDTDFRMSVSRSELSAAVQLMRKQMAERQNILPGGTSRWRQML